MGLVAPSVGSAPPICGWSSSAPGQRSGWPAGPCAAPGCGRGPKRRGPVPRGRGSKVAAGCWLVNRLQPIPLMLRADLAVGFAPPPLVLEGLQPVVCRGRDRHFELQVDGEQRRLGPYSRLSRLGVVWRAALEQKGVVGALTQRPDDHTGAVCHEDRGLGPRQSLRVADGDMRFRRSEHADHPHRALPLPFHHHVGGCQAGMRDGFPVEVWDFRGAVDVAMPSGPQVLLLVRAQDVGRRVGPSWLPPPAGGEGSLSCSTPGSAPVASPWGAGRPPALDC